MVGCKLCLRQRSIFVLQHGGSAVPVVVVVVVVDVFVIIPMLRCIELDFFWSQLVFLSSFLLNF